MGCSPRAVQFSSLVWPFLAMVVLGWLVIMAGTEEAQTSVSVTNRIICCNEMGGAGMRYWKRRIYYRCIDISISALHFPFSFHAWRPARPQSPPPPVLPFTCPPDSFPAPLLRHRLLIGGGSCGFVFITNSSSLSPRQTPENTQASSRNTSINSKDTLT